MNFQEKCSDTMMWRKHLHLDKVIPSERISFLTIGYFALLTASNHITHDDLLAIRSDEVEEKLVGNPLIDTLESLGRIITDKSPESAAREAAKLREAKEAKVTQKSDGPGPLKSITISKLDTADSPLPRQPSTFASTPQKRNISDTSFGTRSTETTPTKLAKPETDIQELQNDFVKDVFRALYGKRRVKVEWPRGRKLNLCYEQYAIRHCWLSVDPTPPRSCAVWREIRQTGSIE
jgi:hypothetical protein